MDWLNYHHLYYFFVLNQEGSFTKAAQKLRISQSAVSEQVMLLESSLGVSLLDRSQRKVLRLTETGLTVFDYAQSIFQTGQEMLRWVKHSEHWTSKILRMGVQSGLSRDVQIEFLKPILGKPEHKVEVVSGDQERLLKLLNDYKIDLILMASALDERFTFQSYAHLLSVSPVCIVSSFLSKVPDKKLDNLLQNTPVYLPAVSLEIRPQIDAFFDSKKIKPNIAGEIDDIALLRLLALSTRSLAVIPMAGVQSDIKSGQLKIVYKFKDIKKHYYAITRQRKFANPVSELLISGMRLSNKS